MKPNILFCLADDASHFGYCGHGYVKTPNIDKLAEEGVVFANAFTTNPKCAPSRASILTGMYPWQLEEGCNHCSYFPEDKEVYPDILERNGYFVGYTGKGWAPGDYERCGRTHNPAGNPYNARTLTPPADSEIDSCDYTANFIDFLDDNKNGNPFCFWFGSKEPHRPYCFGESADFSTQFDDIKYIPTYFPNHDVVKQDILDYAFEINYFDTQVGNMVKILEERGLLNNTIIVITSDNGMPFPRVKGQMYEQDFHLPLAVYWKNNGLKGMKVDNLISFTDFAPTFLDAAGVDSNSMSGVSFLDLIKSGKSSQERDYVYFGREKHDVGSENDLGYPVRCVRDKNYLYIRNYEPSRWPSGNPETVYTNCDNSPTKELILHLAEQGDKRWLDLCFGKRPAEELFNIVKDPECIENLAELPKYLNKKRALSEKLDAKLLETQDPRVTGNPDVFDNYPVMDEFRRRPHSWEIYKEGGFNPIGPLYKEVKGKKLFF